jgi:hypothetical protein
LSRATINSEEASVIHRLKIHARVSVVVSVMVGAALLAAGPALADDPDGIMGPDVVVWDLPGVWNWGSDNGIHAYSVGTTSCNRGDVDLTWVSSTNQHPVIAQNLYRVTLPDSTPPVEHGKVEMLGISWLKHGFVSLNNPGCIDGVCDNVSSGSFLGVGCSDPYSSSLNGSWSNLGPRSEVNAFTGYFPVDHAHPTGDPTIYGRIQAKETELVNDPTKYRYYVEGQYVAPDDAGWPNGVNTGPNNAMNNASYREVILDGGFGLGETGPTFEGMPAIYAWRDADPSVTIREVIVPNEGLFAVGYKVGDNGDGTWHYEYAVFNLNSDLSGSSFSVPIRSDSVITNTGFRDVDYHSGEPYDLTDWVVDVNTLTGWVGWSSVVPDPAIAPENANALRWSTMYNFSFDADSPPEDALATIGLFKSARSVAVFVHAPATNVVPLFTDDFETGDTDGWSSVMP